MNIVLHGMVRGRTVERDHDPGIEQNRTVEVILRTKRLPGPPLGWQPGSSDTAAGMLADSWTSEDHRILEEVYQGRRRSTFREVVE